MGADGRKGKGEGKTPMTKVRGKGIDGRKEKRKGRTLRKGKRKGRRSGYRKWGSVYLGNLLLKPGWAGRFCGKK